MRYVVDHDLHIHTGLSHCSQDPEQTAQRILAYARENRFHTVCITDHFWDEHVPGGMDCYRIQDFAHINRVKPLPEAEDVQLLFGCETDMNLHFAVGVSPERVAAFDFIVIPTTHFHFVDETVAKEDLSTRQRRVAIWEKRLEAALNMPLPYDRVGLAHLVLTAISPSPDRAEYLSTVAAIPEEVMARLFTKAAALGVGIELNSDDISCTDEEEQVVLRPFRIAKACGCKFYFGSDAHHPKALDRARDLFERAVDRLDLKESDKFPIPTPRG